MGKGSQSKKGGRRPILGRFFSSRTDCLLAASYVVRAAVIGCIFSFMFIDTAPVWRGRLLLAAAALFAVAVILQIAMHFSGRRAHDDVDLGWEGRELSPEEARSRRLIIYGLVDRNGN